MHFALKKKIRMEAREKTADPPAEGRPFPRRAWDALPAAELTVGDRAEKSPSADGAEAEAEPSPPAPAPPSPPVGPTSNVTRAHRAVVGARDAVYAKYHVAFEAQARACCCAHAWHVARRVRLCMHVMVQA